MTLNRKRRSLFLLVTVCISLLVEVLVASAQLDLRSYALVFTDDRSAASRGNMISKAKRSRQHAITDSVSGDLSLDSTSMTGMGVKWPVPAKRSTMLLNKLMHALHKALDAENAAASGGGSGGGGFSTNGSPGSGPVGTVVNVPDLMAGAVARQNDMQRRAGEGKMFWRCYFNAVSCF